MADLRITGLTEATSLDDADVFPFVDVDDTTMAATGTTKKGTAALIAAKVGLLTGTGSPEGAVTAAVGTLYSDDAVTLGAGLWRKATGAGNTGWVVVSGDTGWRDVSGDLVNGWTGELKLKRQDNLVTLAGEINESAATSAHFYTVPVGFRANDIAANFGRIYFEGSTSPSGSSQSNRVSLGYHGGEQVKCNQTEAGGGVVYFHGPPWQTQPAIWPASLPGTGV